MLDRRTMPLSALRAFESTGKHLHMGRAGEELGVTHGAISHQIRALEEHLGIKLFDRANNRLKLTDSGQRLLRAVREGFDTIMDGALHLDPDNLTGNLVVGCTQTAGAGWAAKHICDFHALYPQIEIHTMEIKPQQKDIPREIDIAICYGKPNTTGRRLEELTSPPIFPVCSPRLLHGEKTVSQPQHLTRFPLLHDSQNSWQRWFTALNVPMPNHIKQLYFFSTNLSLSAARHGYGIALCNRFEVQEDLREGRLVKLLTRTIPESRSYYLLSDTEEKQSLRAQLFEEWIIEALSSAE